MKKNSKLYDAVSILVMKGISSWMREAGELEIPPRRLPHEVRCRGCYIQSVLIQSVSVSSKSADVIKFDLHTEKTNTTMTRHWYSFHNNVLSHINWFA